MSIEMKQIRRFIKENESFINAVSAKHFVNKTEIEPIDKVILGIYLSTIEKSNAILLLKENNIHSPILSFLRIIFEGRVFMKFLLEDHGDAHRRGKLFMGATLQKELKTTQNIIDDKYENINKMTNERKKFYENQIRDIEENTLYKYYKKESCGKTWHTVVNGKVNNFKAMCLHLGGNYPYYYDLFYTTASDDIHAKNGATRIDFKNGKIQFDDSFVDPVFDFTINKVIIESLIDMSLSLSSYYDLEKNYNLLFPSSKSLIKKTHDYTPKLNF